MRTMQMHRAEFTVIASAYERMPLTAPFSWRRLIEMRAAEGPQLSPHRHPALGPNEYEPAEPRRLQPPELGAELPAAPHDLDHPLGSGKPGSRAHLPGHRECVRHRHVTLHEHRHRVPRLLPR